MAPQSSRQTRRKGRKQTQAARKIKHKTRPQSSSIDIEKLISTAQILEESGRVSDAIPKLEKAVELRPDDASLIEQLSNLYMQAARPDDAEKALREVIKLSPDSGFENYAYLAQLLGNTEEALAIARRGIELMRSEVMGLEANEEERAAELRQYQASAYCAVAEICLGLIEDSNDPEVAKKMDNHVEAAVMEALSMSEEGSPTEIEAVLSLANLRLSQARREEARTAMVRILGRMSEGISKLENGDESDATITGALESLPPMEIRIAVGKQLLEVELWHEAVSVLSSVMWECDFNVEVWYLLAVAYWKLGDKAEARNALESTRAALNNPHGYDGELQEDMIDKLYSKLEVRSDEKQEMQS